MSPLVTALAGVTCGKAGVMVAVALGPGYVRPPSGRLLYDSTVTVLVSAPVPSVEDSARVAGYPSTALSPGAIGPGSVQVTVPAAVSRSPPAVMVPGVTTTPAGMWSTTTAS